MADEEVIRGAARVGASGIAAVVRRGVFHALRIATGALFVYAGTVKVWDFERGEGATQQFALDVQNFQLTGWSASILIAVYLPWVEIAAGSALILRRLTLGALSVLAALMLVFMAALGSAWWRGLDISCGCFGREAENAAADPRALLLRDAAILAVLALLLWREVRTTRELQPGGLTESSPG